MAYLMRGLFGFLTIALLALSWRSLRSWRSHGFFRFFAFESLLALIFLNAGRWFDEPFSLPQMVSWVVLLISLMLAIHGFMLLRRTGRPEGKIENTTRLVTIGIYKVIRHPLYSSLLWFGLGTFLKDINARGGLLLLAIMGFVFATARAEEDENLRRFGDEYRAYMARTKVFIPYFL